MFFKGSMLQFHLDYLFNWRCCKHLLGKHTARTRDTEESKNPCSFLHEAHF
jgi:hypothetical protein